MPCQRATRPCLTIGLIALLLHPPFASAWSGAGHRLVGDIAEAALGSSPEVLERVRRIFGPGVHLRDLSSCADRIRDFVRDPSHPFDAVCAPLVARFSTPQGLITRFGRSDKWHFINIPIDGQAHSMNDVRSFCGSDLCAPDRIEHYKDVLTANASPATQAEAILFLTHLVGDLHQPLHSSVRNKDAGGNLIRVLIFQQEFALHGFWDHEILRHMKNEQGITLQNDEARSAYLRKNLPAAGDFNPWQWALDAYQLAASVAYVNHGELPSGTMIPTRTGPPPTTLHDDKYLAQADPVVQRQLRLAGVRLAAILRDRLK